jgi:toxin HigB-1
MSVITYNITNALWYYAFVIASIAGKETQIVWSGRVSRKLPKGMQTAAFRKLAAIHIATTIDDLRTPPGNRLKKLAGGRAGQWSIRINDQWRVCFYFTDAAQESPAQATAVEIVDYH